MALKKIVLAGLVAALLAGCSKSTATQPSLSASGDPAFSDAGAAAAGTTAGTTAGGNYASPDPGSDTGVTAGLGQPPAATALASARPGAAGSAAPTVVTPEGEVVAAGTLKGTVTDAAGLPLSGATVSIGSQTMLTKDDGSFTFTGITAKSVTMSVTKSGYQALQNESVAIGASGARKDVTLAKPGGDATSAARTVGLTYQLSIGAGTLRGPVYFTVAQDQVLVVDSGYLGLLGHYAKVYGFGGDGSLQETLYKVGLLGFVHHLPSDIRAVSMSPDGNIVASNGVNAYAFSPDGKFVSKTAGGGVATMPSEIRDTVRGATYTLLGKQLRVVSAAGSQLFDIPELGTGHGLAEDSSGHLYILDTAKKVVHEYAVDLGT